MIFKQKNDLRKIFIKAKLIYFGIDDKYPYLTRSLGLL